MAVEELVDRILRGEPFVPPDGASGAIALRRLGANRRGDGDAWFACISEADEAQLIAAIGWIDGIGIPTGFREAARAMVEKKLTDRMVARMEALERASNRLAWVAIAVTVVIAVVQIWAGHR